MSKFSLLFRCVVVYDCDSLMIEKKIFSSAASIIKFIIIFLFFLNAYAESVNKKYEPDEKGILALMYHRFEENQYPSTNIKINVFQNHLNIIRAKSFSFLNPKNFDLEFNEVSEEKKILLTIDDAFSSFYLNAWPILKKNKIPFILFVSTETVGKNGYMNWEEIIEISKEDYVFVSETDTEVVAARVLTPKSEVRFIFHFVPVDDKTALPDKSSILLVLIILILLLVFRRYLQLWLFRQVLLKGLSLTNLHQVV